MKEEIWKPVKGYEGLYEVSSLGRLKALPKKTWHNHSQEYITRKERFFRLNTTDGRGYVNANLTKDSISNPFTIHRIVAAAFIPNPENKRCVNHKNGIKTDNRVENLEWVTHSENSKHSFKIGLQCNKGSRHPTAKLTESEVRRIRELYQPHIYTKTMLAKQFGVCKSSIKQILLRETWTHV